MECIERGSAAWAWLAVVFCSALSTKLRPPHHHPGDNNTLLQDKPKSCGLHGVEVRKAQYLELILSSDTDSRSVADSDSDPRLPPLQYFGLTPPSQR
jgi:hypothetical protein